MIQSLNIDSVSYILLETDLYSPIEDEIRITFTKPEMGFVKTVYVSFASLLNSILILNWCMVALIDEDLLNGKLYLREYGEYTIIVETKSLLDTDWTLIWKDLYRMIGNEIQTYGL